MYRSTDEQPEVDILFFFFFCELMRKCNIVIRASSTDIGLIDISYWSCRYLIHKFTNDFVMRKNVRLLGYHFKHDIVNIKLNWTLEKFRGK